MTGYAFNDDTGELLAVWQTGPGDRAAVVTRVQDPVAGRRLAQTLSMLAEACWRTYTHPASAAGDPEEVNSTAWRRAGERDAFDAALAALRQPHLPARGMVVTSYIQVEEAGHRVGRTLHTLDDAGVIDAVEAEVRREIDAVARAELGDLSGRAEQAVTLSRADVSPTQVQAAWGLLEADPLGCSHALLTTLDPAAAATAAAAWLRGATEVATAGTGLHWTQAVTEADNIEALPYEAPTAVLQALDADATPTEAVLDLVRGAMAVADGDVPDLADLLEQVVEAHERAEQYAHTGVTAEDLLPRRLTLLDPHRPAPDLLEDLLSGLDGCFLLWREENWDLAASPDTGGSHVEDADLLEDEDDEAAAQEEARRLEEAFNDELRARMRRVDRHSL